MSPKCEVASLGQLALYNIVTQVIHALSDDEGVYYDIVSNYHKFTPPEVLEDMLEEILRNENLDAGIRFSCLQVFLTSNVRRLETGIFPQCYYDRILQIIAANGLGLMHLNLKGVWVKENPKLLAGILEKLTQLKVLHIPHMADDEVLRSVAKCANLKVLNISGECNFTRDGLSRFCLDSKLGQLSLTVLDVGSFGEENVSHENVAEILEVMPHLMTLCSYSFVGKSLLFIYKKNKHFTCKLNYVHDTFTTCDICEAVYRTCPILEDLYFDTPSSGVIEMIENFPTLTCLKLTKFKCYEIKQLLSNWGQTLRTIKLSLGSGMLDVTTLAKCPYLTSIEFYKMEAIINTSDPPFCRLHNLEVLHSEMASSCLKYLLERSPELNHVVVGEPIKLTDGDLYRLCADCCLLDLEELLLANARYLTINAVELLMGHCPRLRVIGQLSGWNITTNDVDFMCAVVQSTNTNLALLP